MDIKIPKIVRLLTIAVTNCCVDVPSEVESAIFSTSSFYQLLKPLACSPLKVTLTGLPGSFLLVLCLLLYLFLGISIISMSHLKSFLGKTSSLIWLEVFPLPCRIFIEQLVDSLRHILCPRGLPLSFWNTPRRNYFPEDLPWQLFN